LLIGGKGQGTPFTKTKAFAVTAKSGKKKAKTFQGSNYKPQHIV